MLQHQEIGIWHLGKIKALAMYLTGQPKSLQDILTFFLRNTMFGSSAFAAILNVVREDGSLTIPAKSGFKVWPEEKFPDRFVTVDTPLNRSLRMGEVMDCGSYETFSFAGANYLNDLFPKGFAGSIAIPVPNIGSILIFSASAISLSAEMTDFFYTVGNILALGIRSTSMDLEIDRVGHPVHAVSTLTLTSRQWTIVRAIRKGMTNPIIAENLGYSLSLVRQETMKVYEKLGIAGREELIEMPEEQFPFLASVK